MIFGLSSIIDPRYLLPVLPILAALLAIDFGAVDGEWLPHLSQISRVVLVPVCLVGLVLAVFGAAVYMELVSIATFAAKLRKPSGSAGEYQIVRFGSGAGPRL